MRYALTGATGFVGSHLLELLRAQGHEVTAVVRSADARLDADLVRGDVTDKASLLPAFTGVDGVFHVAGWYKVGDPHPEQGWAVNVQGTRNVMEAAVAANVPRVVYTSTLAINSDTHGEVRDETYIYTGKHLSVYDYTKAQAHRIANSFRDRLDVVTVMPGGIYGPGDTSAIGELIRDTALGKRALAPAGLRLCEAHVDDIAEGHWLAMSVGHRGTSYMLAGEQTTVVDLLKLVAEISGGPQPLVLPDVMVGLTAHTMNLVERVLPVPPTYRAETMRAARASYLGTADKARAELGWNPRDLRTGISQTVEWLKMSQ